MIAMVAGWQSSLGTKEALNKKKPLSAGCASLEGTLGRRWEKERRGKKKKRREKGRWLGRKKKKRE